MSSLRLSLVLLATIVLASCSTLEATDLPTPFPTEYLPTVIALTVEAQDVILQPEDAEIESTEEPVDPSPTPEPIPTDTPTTTISPPIILPTDTLQPTQSAPYSPPPEEVPLSNSLSRTLLEGYLPFHYEGCSQTRPGICGVDRIVR